jgi:hypothetical protein
MSSNTVTKKELYHVSFAFDRYHLGRVLQELTEIFEPNVEYTLSELLELAGEVVYSDRPPVYMTIEEYNHTTPVWKEKRKIPRVGDKYELIPRRIFKYENHITPLFYSAITCRGVKNKRVIQMVTEKIFHDFGFFQTWVDEILPSWQLCKSENEKASANYLYNHYLRMKVGIT